MRLTMKSRLELYSGIRHQTAWMSGMFGLLFAAGLVMTPVAFYRLSLLWLSIFSAVATLCSLIGCIIGMVATMSLHQMLANEIDGIATILSDSDERIPPKKQEYSEEALEMLGELSSQVFWQPRSMEHI